MQFEWDEEKRQKTLKKHGLDFERCREVFEGPVREFRDERREYEEERYIAYGLLDANMVVVVFTPRGADGEIIRIISMRPATRMEIETNAEYIYE